MNSLPRSSFDEVIGKANNYKIFAMLFEVQNTFIGINYLLQIRVFVGNMHKRMILIIDMIEIFCVFYTPIKTGVCCHKYSTKRR